MDILDNNVEDGAARKEEKWKPTKEVHGCSEEGHALVGVTQEDAGIR